MALTVIVSVVCAATANAAVYKMVLCAANNGSNNFETRTNSPGLFDVRTYCGPAGDPAGDAAFLRINETQGGGGASNTAYAQASWTASPWVSILAGGGYTRMPGDFRDGWRGRFWAEGVDGSAPHNILMQGTNADNAGISWLPTPGFGSHLWPFSGWGNYKRFVAELTCMRPAGCDTSGWSAVDFNTIVLTLSDNWTPQTWLTGSDPALMSGAWVRGTRTASFVWSEHGSGIAMERIRIDGADQWVVNHFATGECNVGYSQVNLEFARDFQPCAVADGINRSYTFNSANLSDGAHTLQACTQDYAQYVGLYGTGGASCDQRTILTDNTAPGAPAQLEVTSADPGRYMRSVGARWQLPPNSGSPIAAIHYDVVDAAGQVVMPERRIAATDPTAISGIDLPKAAGAYRVRLWLEDAVGFVGNPATAPVPRDTTPPAAPQSLEAIGPATWGPAQGYRLRWQNVPDSGSPIVAASYQVINGAGEVVTPKTVVSGEGIKAIPGLDVPNTAGTYRVRVWLEDEESNVGSAATVPLPRDTTAPAAPQALSVTPPTTTRAAEGFDLTWQNVPDDGSPIVAAHYQVTDDDGKVVVPTQTETGNAPRSIGNLKTPTAAGTYKVRVWLEDAEGNAGVATTAPLAYECVRSDVGGGDGLSAGFGDRLDRSLVVKEGEGATMTGELRGARKPGAGICVWSRVTTDQGREFVGLALTDDKGRYRFPIGAGPSRELMAGFRLDQREQTASATLRTVVRPTLKLRRKAVRNKQFAVFTGAIPGPHNENVVVVLQVKDGKKWRVFRRYRTREGGTYLLRYRFTRTARPTTFTMRAQVPAQSGLPYEEGVSAPVRLRVLP